MVDLHSETVYEHEVVSYRSQAVSREVIFLN